MRLKNVDVGEGSLSPEQITEFIDQMQVYEGAMYEISTKLEILDSEFQVRFSHNPIHHMERRLKSLNSILGKLQRRFDVDRHDARYALLLHRNAYELARHLHGNLVV